jgi:hypothetical protein
MTTRNFEYRVSPRGPERGSRFTLDAESDALTKGVPVKVTGDFDDQGRAIVELATGAQDKPLPGQGGILDFERFRMDGLDPYNHTYSDADTVDGGRPVQVVTGANRVKVAFRNTTADSFYSRADYPTARIMVAGVSIATPTVAVGNMLTPGTGSDVAGYWAETSDPDEAWLVVTAVDSSTGEVEAIVNF